MLWIDNAAGVGYSVAGDDSLDGGSGDDLFDAGTGDDQTIPGVYGVINYARVQPTGSNRTVTYNIGARNWVDINKSDLTAIDNEHNCN